MALACTWGAFADTDLAVGSFFGGNHTVAFRFLPRFPAAYEGPILASTDTDRWVIALGDFCMDPGPGPKILVSVPGAMVMTPVSIRRDEWHHIALVKRDDAKLTLFVDGTPATALWVPTGLAPPTGTVRFGKKSFQVTGRGAGVAQFYGLIDDVAIFTSAVDAERVRELAAGGLTGNEASLLAGYTFPPGGTDTLPERLRRTVDLHGGALMVEPSSNRSGAEDAALVPFAPSVPTMLPIRPGDEWLVAQGYDQPEPGRTHRCAASFCWDLVANSTPATSVGDNSDTLASTVAVAAPGTVERLDAGNAPPSAENFVSIKHAELEFGDYLHLAQDSVTLTAGAAVEAGQDLGTPGDMRPNNPTVHLHFAVTTLGHQHTDPDPGVTIPIGFSDYDVSDDNRRSWKYVRQGMPRAGQWVRQHLEPDADTTVPDVLGDSREDAKAAVETAGLVPRFLPLTTSALFVVIRQNPSAGTVVPRGSIVTLTLEIDE